MTEQKEKRGGRRAGAGRPRKSAGERIIYLTTTISGRPDEVEKLRQLADEADKTVSRYVFDTILQRD